MLLEQVSTAGSLLRTLAGLLALNLPLFLGAWLGSRICSAFIPKAKSPPFSQASAPQQFCHGIVIGWSQLVLTFVFLGSVGVLSFWTATGLQWLALLGWILLSRRIPEPGETQKTATAGKLPALPGSQTEVSAVWGKTAHRRRRALAGWSLLVLGLTLGPWFQQLSMPPVMEDSLTYHMSFPAEWLESGEIRMPIQHDADMGPTYYPFAGEVLLGWWMLTFGSDQFATGSGILWIPVLLAALLAATGLLGCGSSSAAAAWAFLATSPLVVWLTLVAFNDLALTAALLLALATALQFCRNPGWVTATLSGAALGLVVGTKYSGLAFGSGVALIALAGLIQEILSNGMKRASALALAMGGTGLAIGGYAYARNLLLTGSPIYPAHLELLGFRVFDGLYGVQNWLAHPHHQFDWRKFLLTAPGAARFGWPAIWGLPLLAAVSAVLLLLRKKVLLLLPLAAGFIGLAAFWTSSPYRHDPRFYIPVLALMAAAAIPALDALSRRTGRLFEILFIPALLACFARAESGLGSQTQYLVTGGLLLLWAFLPTRTARMLTGKTATACALGAAILGLALAQPSYLENRSARWETIYARQRGKIWSAVHRISPPGGLTVAAAGTSNTYPLYGADLRNRVLFVPRNSHGRSIAYGFGYPFGSPFDNPTPQAWLKNLEALAVDLLVLGPGRCPERAWIRGNPTRFHLELQAGGYSLYRVL